MPDIKSVMDKAKKAKMKKKCPDCGQSIGNCSSDCECGSCS